MQLPRRSGRASKRNHTHKRDRLGRTHAGASRSSAGEAERCDLRSASDVGRAGPRNRSFRQDTGRLSTIGMASSGPAGQGCRRPAQAVARWSWNSAGRGSHGEARPANRGDSSAGLPPWGWRFPNAGLWRRSLLPRESRTPRSRRRQPGPAIPAGIPRTQAAGLRRQSGRPEEVLRARSSKGGGQRSK
jgi:hypothetical protein